MPIYLYQCQNCQYQSEELILNKKKYRTKKCPKCEQGVMSRQPTTLSIKGSSACNSCSRDCSTCH